MTTKHERLAEYITAHLSALRQNNPTEKSRQKIVALFEDSHSDAEIQTCLLRELDELQEQHQALIGPIDHQSTISSNAAHSALIDLQVTHSLLHQHSLRQRTQTYDLMDENDDLKATNHELARRNAELRQKYERTLRKNDELTRTLVKTRNAIKEVAAHGMGGVFDMTTMAGGILCGVLANLLSAKVLREL